MCLKIIYMIYQILNCKLRWIFELAHGKCVPLSARSPGSWYWLTPQRTSHQSCKIHFFKIDLIWHIPDIEEFGMIFIVNINVCAAVFLPVFLLQKSWLPDINYKSCKTFPSKFRLCDIFPTWGVDWSYLTLIQPFKEGKSGEEILTSYLISRYKYTNT